MGTAEQLTDSSPKLAAVLWHGGRSSGRKHKEKTHPGVGALVVRHAQQARAGLVHLVGAAWGGRACGVALFQLVGSDVGVVAVDGRRACWRGLSCTRKRGRGSRGAGCEEGRLGGDSGGGGRGAAGFDEGRGRALELAASLSQEGKAGQGVAPAVGAGTGGRRGRRDVASGGSEGSSV